MQEPQVRWSLQGAAGPEAEVLVLPLGVGLRRFSGGPALSAGLATRLSTRAIVPAVKIQKKGPLGLGRKRAVKTAGGGYYAPGAWNQVLFSDFFLPSGFPLVCPAFPETAFHLPG